VLEIPQHDLFTTGHGQLLAIWDEHGIAYQSTSAPWIRTSFSQMGLYLKVDLDQSDRRPDPF
jgi:hypothetical protein